MKWIVLLALIAGGVWVYYNVDFNQLGQDTHNAILQEKTMKKFFEADRQNKQETQEVIDTF